MYPKCLTLLISKLGKEYIDAVEWKGRNWILQTFQYEEKTISQNYT